MATVWPLPPVDAADVRPYAARRSAGPKPRWVPDVVVVVVASVVLVLVLVVVVAGLAVVVVVLRRTVVVVSRPRTPPTLGLAATAADHARWSVNSTDVHRTVPGSTFGHTGSSSGRACTAEPTSSAARAAAGTPSAEATRRTTATALPRGPRLGLI